MRRRRATLRLALLALCVVATGGCATVRTLTDYQPGDPVFMSGTRLNLAAINNNKAVLDRLQAKPPAWPWLDLPFSFAADSVFWMLPRTRSTSPSTPGES